MERVARGLQTPAGWPWRSLKSSSPAQELLGDVAWLLRLPPTQLDWVRKRAGRLHSQLRADVFQGGKSREGVVRKEREKF